MMRDASNRTAQRGIEIVLVRPAQPDDLEQWLELRAALWPDEASTHASEIERYFVDGTIDNIPHIVLIAVVDEPARAIGFAEVSVREAAAGCRTSPVAYLEGWYVRPESRVGGVGRALVDGARRWAVQRGLREFASDTAPEFAEISVPAHLACGFRAVADAPSPSAGAIAFMMSLHDS
ncbi:MAG: GNAT family N-acetyltransferase [Planctomycetota bacterium]|nr:GNAT family N-acetyltransferase [Planctomycetota bacterium]